MIGELGAKLAARQVSAVELTQEHLKRIKADSTNSYITVSESEALEAARAADARIARKGRLGALDGIPVAVKDALCTKGIRTTCASKILGDYRPPYDATAVARLKAAGAPILGKLNMDEFAMGGSNENSAFGPVLNPLARDRVPGGSSGGSAAAVKAGLAVATLGSDTGGSIRLPAAYCGVVGLKPTYGAVSRYGLVAFASSLDQIGPLGATVEDCALVFKEIAGPDPLDSTSGSTRYGDFVDEVGKARKRKLRVGIPREYLVEGIQPDVVKALDSVKKTLEKQGHALKEISLPHTEYSVAVYYIVAVSEASSNLSRFDGVRFGTRAAAPGGSLAEMYKSTRALFGQEVKRRIILGTFALSAGYYDAYYRKACQVRRLIRNDFDRAFREVDVILGPVAPTTAFKLGEKTADPLQMYLNDILTIPVNLAGLPAVSVPAGRDSAGLPIGVQFIGKAFAEADVLAAAQHVEEHHGV